MCTSANNADSIALICILFEKSFANTRGCSDDYDIHIAFLCAKVIVYQYA